MSTTTAKYRSPARTPLALALVAALGVAPLAASAATITVTSAADPGDSSSCTLRQAVTSMNSAVVTGTDCSNTGDFFGTDDQIVFDSAVFPVGGTNTITLADGQLAISAADLTIDAGANGNVTIDANHTSRVMKDSAPAGDSLALSHLTLINGRASTADCTSYKQGGGICIPHADLTLTHSTLSGNSADWGGGIFSRDGNVTLTHSTLSGNSAANSGGGIDARDGSVTLTQSIVNDNSADSKGGGIYADDGSVTLTQSTVSDNSAGSKGGGIFSYHGSITLTNSTVSGNSTDWLGGGIYAVYGSATLTQNTVSGNSADWGGGIFSRFGIFTLTNSTLSGNWADYDGSGIFSDYGSIIANNSIVAGNSGGGGNIYGTVSAGSHNLIGGDPMLGALADNGSPTRTMMPQAGSPAIDAGADSICPTTDQRGALRPQGSRCDIGAVELAVVPDAIVATYGSGQLATLWHTFFNPLIVQVLDASGRPAKGVALRADASVSSQAGAICSDARSNATGFAYMYCRANGIAGSYSVEVSAVGWPSAAPATFVLTNADDGDTLFRDGFDPPGPRTSMLTADPADAKFALQVPGNLPDNRPVPLHLVTGADGTPLLRVDAVDRDGHSLLRVVHYANGKPLAPGAWQSAGRTPRLYLQRQAGQITARIR